jgi:hypothetical protein
MTISEQQDKTNHALSLIQSRLPDLDEAPLPPAVFHYTDANGLQGILETGVLWATHYRYLNDSPELRYIFDLAIRVVEEQARFSKQGSLTRAFLEHAGSATPPYGDTAYYLCCFSEADNSLSQWRAYGGRQGFSLGFPGDITFSPALLEVPARQGQTAGITLLRVDYRVERHTEYVTTLIRELMQLCDGEHMQSYDDLATAISHVSPFYFGQLERASYRFKHPDFADEQEWRLVSWAEQPEYFRVGATLTPFAKMRILSASHWNPNPKGVPLTAIRYGPTPLPDETRLALERLLCSQGYPDSYCERRGSETPVRLQ